MSCLYLLRSFLLLHTANINGRTAVICAVIARGTSVKL